MIKIALCDDDKRALPIISGAASSALAGQNVKCEIEEFDSGKSLLEAMNKKVEKLRDELNLLVQKIKAVDEHMTED